MPHAKLVEHSTAMARAVGEAYAQLHNVRAAGVSATAMVALGTLEGALARVSESNAAMGELAQGLDDQAPADAKDASGAGKSVVKTGA